ncbi:hypothetical protein TJCWGUJI_CDS0143 [Enterococcus phage VRE9_1]
MKVSLELNNVEPGLLDSIVRLVGDNQVKFDMTEEVEASLEEIILDSSYLYQINGEYHSIVDIDQETQIVIFSDIYANIRTFFLDTLQFYNIKRMADPSLLDKFLEKQIELDGGLE